MLRPLLIDCDVIFNMLIMLIHVYFNNDFANVEQPVKLDKNILVCSVIMHSYASCAHCLCTRSNVRLHIINTR